MSIMTDSKPELFKRLDCNVQILADLLAHASFEKLDNKDSRYAISKTQEVYADLLKLAGMQHSGPSRHILADILSDHADEIIKLIGKDKFSDALNGYVEERSERADCIKAVEGGK